MLGNILIFVLGFITGIATLCGIAIWYDGYKKRGYK